MYANNICCPSSFRSQTTAAAAAAARTLHHHDLPRIGLDVRFLFALFLLPIRVVATAYYQVVIHSSWPEDEGDRIAASVACVLLAVKSVDQLPSPHLSLLVETGFMLRWNVNIKAVPEKVEEFKRKVLAWEKRILLGLNFNFLIEEVYSCYSTVNDGLAAMVDMLDPEKLPPSKIPDVDKRLAHLKHEIQALATRYLQDAFKTRAILMLTGREMGLAALVKAVQKVTKGGLLAEQNLPLIAGKPWYILGLGLNQTRLDSFNEELARLYGASQKPPPPPR